MTTNVSRQHNNFVWKNFPIHIGEDHVQSSVKIRFGHLQVLKHTSYYYSDLAMVMRFQNIGSHIVSTCHLCLVEVVAE